MKWKLAAAAASLATDDGYGCCFSCNGNPLSLLLLKWKPAAATASTLTADGCGLDGWAPGVGVRVECNPKLLLSFLP
jgi:hypothetical protein